MSATPLHTPALGKPIILALCVMITGSGCNHRFDFDEDGNGSTFGTGGVASISDAAVAGRTWGGSGPDAGSERDHCASYCEQHGQVCTSDDELSCVECNLDGDCDHAERPRCSGRTHTCVACFTSTDCKGSLPRTCVAGECRPACTYGASDDACGGGEHTYCNSSDVCCSCDSDHDCAGSPSTPRCLLPGWYCVACTSSSQCSGATPRCDPVSHACVACAEGHDCPSGCCDTETHTCSTD